MSSFFLTSAGEFWGTGVLLAFALSMDSFCTSTIDGYDERTKKKRVFWIIFSALVFAVFHFMMPVIGYFFGSLFLEYIKDYTKWFSFGILVAIGLKGIIEELLEMHVEKMEKIAQSCNFDSSDYLKRMYAQGKSLKEIKKEFKVLGRALKKDEEHGIESLKYEDHKKCHALGVYLIHETRYLNERRLQEIVNPEVKESDEKKDTLSFLLTLFLQALATSLDALAVGFSFVGTDIASALCMFALFFGVIFGMCVLGGFLGKLFGERYQRIANFIGAAVLILLGIKALF